MLTAVTACGGGSSTDGGSNDSPRPHLLASNQGASVEIDKKVLQPELDKFQKDTGIKVELEVVPWSDLLNRILTATTSGQGPDVLNIGNTWSASLQATGGCCPGTPRTRRDRRQGPLRRLGPRLDGRYGPGPGRGAVVLDVVRALLQQGPVRRRRHREAAGHLGRVRRRRQEALQGRQVGCGLRRLQPAENIHHAVVFAKQHGGDFFTADGKPDFTNDGAVEGVKQFVDLMATDKVVAPGNAEYAQNQSVSDFATGKTGMLLWQSASANLESQGMSADDFGIAPVPVQSGTPGAARTSTRCHGYQPGRLQEHRQPRRLDRVREVLDQ